MITIQARNAHRALSHALYVMDTRGEKRHSRNGDVLVTPFPVTTEYARPLERVVFWPQRDCNPFYHLFEGLWMLSGSNDIRTLSRFAKNVTDYSDDGRTWWGGYGERWRLRFGGRDQLDIIVERLTRDPDDRRCVLQMWDTREDLGRSFKDVPCNVTATVQRGLEGQLDLTVFCRSNDIIWGCYGANVVHFSMLQEYLALRIGCPVGTFRQVSVNWHAYVDKYESLRDLPRESSDDPYYKGLVHPVMMGTTEQNPDRFIRDLMHDLDRDLLDMRGPTGVAWADMAVTMMTAHQFYRTLKRPDNYHRALYALDCYPDQTADWIRAGQEWLQRRLSRYEAKVMDAE